MTPSASYNMSSHKPSLQKTSNSSKTTIVIVYNLPAYEPSAHTSTIDANKDEHINTNTDKQRKMYTYKNTHEDEQKHTFNARST